MYNTILVPTDFSNEEQTIQALKKAEELSDNGRIILLHVLEPMPSYVLAVIPQDIIQNQLPPTQEALEYIVAKSGVKAEIEVREGGSYSNILESAKEAGADLILINSHRPELKDYLLGSTAARVVRHAKCSVLVNR